MNTNFGNISIEGFIIATTLPCVVVCAVSEKSQSLHTTATRLEKHTTYKTSNMQHYLNVFLHTVSY